MNRKARRVTLAHARNRPPSFRREAAPQPVEVEPPPGMREEFLNAANDYLKVYLMGGCSIIVTREYGRWHLSIDGKTRYPTWLEISKAWYTLVPGAAGLTGALPLPPLADYLNLNEFVMQVFESASEEPTP